jgi:ketosteroid isomerase-like protein
MRGEAEWALTDLYAAFNRRDIDAVLAAMHPDVDWPNAWEGGRVAGREGARAYWERQFGQISSRVEPVGFLVEDAENAVVVDVDQVVRDPRSGELLDERRVRHRYEFEDGLIVRMDVLGD